MFKTKRNIVLGLTVCALLLPTTGSAKQQVERPLRIQCQGVTDLTDGTAVMTGETTHSGRFTNVASPTGPDTAAGCLTGANGDMVYWTSTSTATPIRPTEVWVELTVTISGGTGKFAGATGGFYAAYVATLHFETMTATYGFVGTGTMTY